MCGTVNRSPSDRQCVQWPDQGRSGPTWSQFGIPGWLRSARWLPRFRPHQGVKPNPWLPVLLRERDAAHKSPEAASTVVTVVQLLLLARIYVCRNMHLGRQVGNGHGGATGAPIISSTRQHCQSQSQGRRSTENSGSHALGLAPARAIVTHAAATLPISHRALSRCHFGLRRHGDIIGLVARRRAVWYNYFE